MSFSRREFALTLGAFGGAFGLSACNGSRGSTAAPRSAGLAPEFRPQPNAGYDAWVSSFKNRAGGYGLSAATIAAGFRGAGFLPGVIKRDRNQTEFKRSLED